MPDLLGIPETRLPVDPADAALEVPRHALDAARTCPASLTRLGDARGRGAGAGRMSRHTPMPGPDITADSTLLRRRAGAARGRSRGRTSPTAASSGHFAALARAADAIGEEDECPVHRVPARSSLDAARPSASEGVHATPPGRSAGVTARSLCRSGDSPPGDGGVVDRLDARIEGRVELRPGHLRGQPLGERAKLAMTPGLARELGVGLPRLQPPEKATTRMTLGG